MKPIKQKVITFVLIGILIYPSITLASWWNPFTWFKKKSAVPVEQVVQAPVNPLVVEKKSNPVTPKTIEPKKVDTTVAPKPALPVATQSVVSSTALAISNINVESTSNSAHISWQTSMPSESKLLIDGKVYFSKNSVDTLHYVEVSLSSGTSYTGTITALANNAWVNKEITFSTKQAPSPAPVPLQVTLGNKNCTSNSCKVEWQTNYPTTSSITITKVGQNNVSWLFESENSNATGHWKTLNNLSPNTQYFFILNAVSDSGSMQTQGNFTTKEQVQSCSGGMACP